MMTEDQFNGKDPAFPQDYPVHNGLNKREYFAGLAMQGILSGTWNKRSMAPPTPEEASSYAVEYADTLLRELEKER